MPSSSSAPPESPIAATTGRRLAGSAASRLAPARQPFLYLTTALVCGILVDHWLMPSACLIWPLLAVAVAFAVWLVIGRRSTQATVVLLTSFALAGALLARAERLDVAQSR